MQVVSVWVWLSVGMAVALLVAAIAFFASRKKLRPSARRSTAPRYPVVFAHGLLGFDEITLRGKKHEYFRGLSEKLRVAGVETYALRVAPAGSIAARAEQLAQAVRSLPAERVNIIAHSMGGLDARYAISRLGLAAKVVSLTTIGTPHQGTPLADLGTSFLGDKLGIRKLCQALGIDVQAFYDLTTARLRTFNLDTPDVKGVAYGSVVAAAPSSLTGISPFLVPSFLYLKQQHGENDGIVPTTSQAWGSPLARIEADHWAQIGWSGRFDAPSFYAQILLELRGRGF